MRAKYQVAIWTKSEQAQPEIWNPEGNGWKKNQEGFLQPVLYEKEAAPLEVRDLIHLYCTDDACTITRKCHCLVSGLWCTELCSCHKSESTCGNVKQEFEVPDSSDSDGEESDADVDNSDNE